MSDLGERFTERRLEEVKKELGRIYTEAENDLRKKVLQYTKDYVRIDAHKRALVASGKLTEAEYKRWQQGQVFIGNRWKSKVQQMARSLVRVEENAEKLVYERQLSCFADNTNYFEFRIDKEHGFSGNFGVYDTASVARIIEEEPELLRRRYVKQVKCEAWNVKIINNCITQGILQGESIQQIAERMARDTASADMKAMVRYARTAMTGAQNGGRIRAMRESKRLGIYVRKVWIAVADDRTRDAHLDLDGKVAEVDKPFESELGPIMFPGDPNASDANIWNCRCALGYEYPSRAEEAEAYGEVYEGEEEEFDEWCRTHNAA